MVVGWARRAQPSKTSIATVRGTCVYALHRAMTCCAHCHRCVFTATLGDASCAHAQPGTASTRVRVGLRTGTLLMTSRERVHTGATRDNQEQACMSTNVARMFRGMPIAMET
eukprot:15157077-Alexandrium_andersonii.AAC.1